MQNLNLAKEVRRQKLREGQEIGKLVLLAEARLGELFNQLPKQQGGDRRSENFKLPPAGKFENDDSETESEDEKGNEEKPPQKPKLVVAAEMLSFFPFRGWRRLNSYLQVIVIKCKYPNN